MQIVDPRGRVVGAGKGLAPRIEPGAEALHSKPKTPRKEWLPLWSGVSPSSKVDNYRYGTCKRPPPRAAS